MSESENVFGESTIDESPLPSSKMDDRNRLVLSRSEYDTYFNPNRYFAEGFEPSSRAFLYGVPEPPQEFTDGLVDPVSVLDQVYDDETGEVDWETFAGLRSKAAADSAGYTAGMLPYDLAATNDENFALLEQELAAIEQEAGELADWQRADIIDSLMNAESLNSEQVQAIAELATAPISMEDFEIAASELLMGAWYENFMREWDQTGTNEAIFAGSPWAGGSRRREFLKDDEGEIVTDALGQPVMVEGERELIQSTHDRRDALWNSLPEWQRAYLEERGLTWDPNFAGDLGSEINAVAGPVQAGLGQVVRGVFGFFQGVEDTKNAVYRGAVIEQDEAGTLMPEDAGSLLGDPDEMLDAEELRGLESGSRMDDEMLRSWFAMANFRQFGNRYEAGGGRSGGNEVFLPSQMDRVREQYDLGEGTMTFVLGIAAELDAAIYGNGALLDTLVAAEDDERGAFATFRSVVNGDVEVSDLNDEQLAELNVAYDAAFREAAQQYVVQTIPGGSEETVRKRAAMLALLTNSEVIGQASTDLAMSGKINQGNIAALRSGMQPGTREFSSMSGRTNFISALVTDPLMAIGPVVKGSRLLAGTNATGDFTAVSQRVRRLWDASNGSTTGNIANNFAARGFRRVVDDVAISVRQTIEERINAGSSGGLNATVVDGTRTVSTGADRIARRQPRWNDVYDGVVDFAWKRMQSQFRTIARMDVDDATKARLREGLFKVDEETGRRTLEWDVSETIVDYLASEAGVMAMRTGRLGGVMNNQVSIPTDTWLTFIQKSAKRGLALAVDGVADAGWQFMRRMASRGMLNDLATDKLRDAVERIGASVTDSLEKYDEGQQAAQEFRRIAPERLAGIPESLDRVRRGLDSGQLDDATVSELIRVIEYKLDDLQRKFDNNMKKDEQFDPRTITEGWQDLAYMLSTLRAHGTDALPHLSQAVLGIAGGYDIGRVMRAINAVRKADVPDVNAFTKIVHTIGAIGLVAPVNAARLIRSFTHITPSQALELGRSGNMSIVRDFASLMPAELRARYINQFVAAPNEGAQMLVLRSLMNEMFNALGVPYTKSGRDFISEAMRHLDMANGHLFSAKPGLSHINEGGTRTAAAIGASDLSTKQYLPNFRAAAKYARRMNIIDNFVLPGHQSKYIDRMMSMWAPITLASAGFPVRSTIDEVLMFGAREGIGSYIRGRMAMSSLDGVSLGRNLASRWATRGYRFKPLIPMFMPHNLLGAAALRIKFWNARRIGGMKGGERMERISRYIGMSAEDARQVRGLVDGTIDRDQLKVGLIQRQFVQNLRNSRPAKAWVASEYGRLSDWFDWLSEMGPSALEDMFRRRARRFTVRSSSAMDPSSRAAEWFRAAQRATLDDDFVDNIHTMYSYANDVGRHAPRPNELSAAHQGSGYNNEFNLPVDESPWAANGRAPHDQRIYSDLVRDGYRRYVNGHPRYQQALEDVYDRLLNDHIYRHVIEQHAFGQMNDEGVEVGASLGEMLQNGDLTYDEYKEAILDSLVDYLMNSPDVQRSRHARASRTRDGGVDPYGFQWVHNHLRETPGGGGSMGKTDGLPNRNVLTDDEASVLQMEHEARMAEEAAIAPEGLDRPRAHDEYVINSLAEAENIPDYIRDRADLDLFMAYITKHMSREDRVALTMLDLDEGITIQWDVEKVNDLLADVTAAAGQGRRARASLSQEDVGDLWGRLTSWMVTDEMSRGTPNSVVVTRDDPYGAAAEQGFLVYSYDDAGDVDGLMRVISDREYGAVDIAVRPDRRRKGVASRMVNETEDQTGADVRAIGRSSGDYTGPGAAFANRAPRGVDNALFQSVDDIVRFFNARHGTVDEFTEGWDDVMGMLIEAASYEEADRFLDDGLINLFQHILAYTEDMAPGRRGSDGWPMNLDMSDPENLSMVYDAIAEFEGEAPRVLREVIESMTELRYPERIQQFDNIVGPEAALAGYPNLRSIRDNTKGFVDELDELINEGVQALPGRLGEVIAEYMTATPERQAELAESLTAALRAMDVDGPTAEFMLDVYDQMPRVDLPIASGPAIRTYDQHLDSLAEMSPNAAAIFESAWRRALNDAQLEFEDVLRMDLDEFDSFVANHVRGNLGGIGGRRRRRSDNESDVIAARLEHDDMQRLYIDKYRSMRDELREMRGDGPSNKAEEALVVLRRLRDEQEDADRALPFDDFINWLENHPDAMNARTSSPFASASRRWLDSVNSSVHNVDSRSAGTGAMTPSGGEMDAMLAQIEAIRRDVRRMEAQAELPTSMDQLARMTEEVIADIGLDGTMNPVVLLEVRNHLRRSLGRMRQNETTDDPVDIARAFHPEVEVPEDDVLGAAGPELVGVTDEYPVVTQAEYPVPMPEQRPSSAADEARRRDEYAAYHADDPGPAGAQEGVTAPRPPETVPVGSDAPKTFSGMWDRGDTRHVVETEEVYRSWAEDIFSNFEHFFFYDTPGMGLHFWDSKMSFATRKDHGLFVAGEEGMVPVGSDPWAEGIRPGTQVVELPLDESMHDEVYDSILNGVPIRGAFHFNAPVRDEELAYIGDAVAEMLTDMSGEALRSGGTTVGMPRTLDQFLDFVHKNRDTQDPDVLDFIAVAMSRAKSKMSQEQRQSFTAMIDNISTENMKRPLPVDNVAASLTSGDESNMLMGQIDKLWPQSAYGVSERVVPRAGETPGLGLGREMINDVFSFLMPYIDYLSREPMLAHYYDDGFRNAMEVLAGSRGLHFSEALNVIRDSEMDARNAKEAIELVVSAEARAYGLMEHLMENVHSEKQLEQLVLETIGDDPRLILSNSRWLDHNVRVSLVDRYIYATSPEFRTLVDEVMPLHIETGLIDAKDLQSRVSLVETVTKMLDQQRIVELDAHEAAMNFAYVRMATYTDNEPVSTLFSSRFRNIFPFFWAEERFIKRFVMTTYHSPASMHRAQMAYKGATTQGFFSEDADGNPVFVYPWGEMMSSGMGRLLSFVFGKEALRFPQLYTNQGRIDLLVPGGIESGIIPDNASSPYMGLHANVLRWLNPKVEALLARAFGDETAARATDTFQEGVDAVTGPFISDTSRRLEQTFVPPRVLRIWDAMTKNMTDTEIREAYASHTFLALTFMFSNPDDPTNPLPGPDATQEELQDFQNSLADTVDLLVVESALQGLFGFTPPDMEVSQSEQHQEFRRLVAESGFILGAEEFNRRYPDANLNTLFATQSESGAPLPATAELYDELNRVPDLYEANIGAAFLIPTDAIEQSPEFDSRAWNTQRALGMREYRGGDGSDWIENLIGDFYFAAGAREYFDYRGEKQARIRELELQGWTTEADIQSEMLERWTAEYLHNNPIFARELESTERQDRRQRVIDNLHEIRNDERVADSKRAALTYELLDMFDAYNNLRQEWEPGSGANDALRDQLRRTFLSEATALVNANPNELVPIWRSVFAPELGYIEGEETDWYAAQDALIEARN